MTITTDSPMLELLSGFIIELRTTSSGGGASAMTGADGMYRVL